MELSFLPYVKIQVPRFCFPSVSSCSWWGTITKTLCALRAATRHDLIWIHVAPTKPPLIWDIAFVLALSFVCSNDIDLRVGNISLSCTVHASVVYDAAVRTRVCLDMFFLYSSSLVIFFSFKLRKFCPLSSQPTVLVEAFSFWKGGRHKAWWKRVGEASITFRAFSTQLERSWT